MAGGTVMQWFPNKASNLHFTFSKGESNGEFHHGESACLSEDREFK